MSSSSKVNVTLPSASGANIDVANRGGRYGDQYVMPVATGVVNLCEEGSYFTVINPTPGTGLATVGSTGCQSLSDLVTFFMLINNDVVGGKNLYLDYLKLICTVAGTAGASLHYTTKIDNGVGRYSSGTTLTSTPVNCNMNSSRTTVTLAYAGPVVTLAATASVRILSNGVLKTGIPVIGDTYILDFGAKAIGVGSAVATINSVIFNHPPMVLGPQQSFFLHLWLPSQSAASSYELEVGWWER